MEQEIDAMATSLRVLAAVVESRDPEPADVLELRRLAPLSVGAPPEELACELILRALKRREKSRNMVAKLGKPEA
jgi:hypothetical protein